MPRCDRAGCGHQGPADGFKPAIGVYHDMHCPKCGTTQVDTTDIFEEWAARGEHYAYGKHNVLIVPDTHRKHPEY